jgi:3-deoxy-7-phosphoheptulonate synthase
MSTLENLKVRFASALITPEEMKRKLPVSDDMRHFITGSRQTIKNILQGSDHRLFVVVGPCSIHDPKAALEYAHRLKQLADNVSDTLYLVMRVYFEKPRTAVGWKGLINDPYLDGSFKMDDGLMIARQLLIDVAELGLPAATEALDPIAPQYFQDLITWSAIGARTTESQTHRGMASGLSSIVGFKNGTDGSLQAAINAIKSSAESHGFLGIDSEGRISVIQTVGNTDTHIVLRGGRSPNYDSVNVALCERIFKEHGLHPNIMIDCSHANSQGNYELQPLVMNDVVNQILDGNRSIKALMIESNLHEGRQPSTMRCADLRYGVSITDACISWEITERSLYGIREKLRYVLQGRTHAELVAAC